MKWAGYLHCSSFRLLAQKGHIHIPRITETPFQEQMRSERVQKGRVVYFMLYSDLFIYFVLRNKNNKIDEKIYIFKIKYYLIKHSQ
jgi:hypothetical protein